MVLTCKDPSTWNDLLLHPCRESPYTKLQNDIKIPLKSLLEANQVSSFGQLHFQALDKKMRICYTPLHV